jgi:lysophospholipase L1-like esterase
MKRILGLILICALVSACQSVKQIPLSELDPVVPKTQKAAFMGDIDWEVENRYRLIPAKVDPTTISARGEAPLDEEKRFYRDVASLIEEQHEWYRREARASIFANPAKFDLIHPLKGSTRAFRNYETHYSTVTESYRCSKDSVRDGYNPLCTGDPSSGQDWLTDQNRTVDVRVKGFDGAPCIWTVDGADTTGPCTGFKVHVIVDQPKVVSVRLVGEGKTSLGSVTVNVRDVKIVALGDSFSAGEGIPHSQWRGFIIGRRPAIWLDPRCHRSLLSGPALTAAYLARRDPKISVTLLHYGCSGASVADGVASPWGYLETHKTISKRNSKFTEALAPWQGQETVEMNGPGMPDVGRSQIGQAVQDLTWDGVFHKPDFVILSVGGNDIGFGSIVQATILPVLAEDLKPKPVEDPRTVAPFDETMWRRVSKTGPCPDKDRFNCMAFQVGERINGVSGATTDAEPRILTHQYAALRSALDQLLPGSQNRVLITEYPYFLFREQLPSDTESSIYHLKTGETAAACWDVALDGRAGMVPGIAAWIPGFGIRKGESIKAANAFQRPLNDAIENAAVVSHDPANDWLVVKAHVVAGRTHGYCSRERYFNTVFDSYWYQGRKYGDGRDLANVEIVRDEFALPIGSRYVWNSKSPKPCFESWDYSDPVLRASAVDCVSDSSAVHAQFYQPIPGRTNKGFLGSVFGSFMSNIATTGPVHPNFFGHCNYAAAIVSDMVRSNPTKIDFNPDLVADVTGGRLLNAEDICMAEVWGYRSKYYAQKAK